MTDTTQDQQQEETDVPTAFGWCSWHRGFSDGVRVIEVVERMSGPGVNVFACKPCRERNGLVPFADRPR